MSAIVVVNCGSSSVKVDVFAGAAGEHAAPPLVSLSIERVGTDKAQLTKSRNGERHREALHAPDVEAALQRVLEEIDTSGVAVGAFGHRVVHGGARFSDSVVIDADVVAAVEACVPLAPLHNPANLAGIAACQRRYPAVPHVAVFDTAFHQTLPPERYLYALPRALYHQERVRRYGFHGTSHRFVASQAAHLLGRPLSSLNLVTLHLGNGCSGCAIAAGHSVDTTMGLTPLEGLVMGTRAGDVDPGVVLRLARERGVDQAEQLLNKQSGLLGLSGTSQDMRDLLAAEARGDGHAAEAVAVFCARAAKATGALATALPRLDAVVFTGGIGENAAPVRARIAAHLAVFGVQIDDDKNAAGGEGVVSRGDGPAVLVVATDEEWAIAREVARLTAAGA